MTVYVDADERYPVYSLHDDRCIGRVLADLSEEEVTYMRSVLTAYEQVQRALHHLHQTGVRVAFRLNPPMALAHGPWRKGETDEPTHS